jgi:hypothetical protein
MGQGNPRGKHQALARPIRRRSANTTNVPPCRTAKQDQLRSDMSCIRRTVHVISRLVSGARAALGQSAPSSFVAATTELASIADAGEAWRGPSRVGHITATTGAPQRPDATAARGGACTGPRAAARAAKKVAGDCPPSEMQPHSQMRTRVAVPTPVEPSKPCWARATRRRTRTAFACASGRSEIRRETRARDSAHTEVCD